MCSGILIFILVIIGLVWVVKKLDEPTYKDKNKEDLRYLIQDIKDEFSQEIKQLKEKIRLLEAEINRIKGIPEPSQDITELSKPEPVQNTVEIEPVPEPVYEMDVSIEPTEPVEKVVQIEENVLLDKILEGKTQKNDLESFVAGNLLNRIGALALIIGMGFFLKYAFDQNWISPIVQILTGFLVAGGLLFGASHFNKQDNYKVFAQGLAGAGISISYLSIFAAYSFYHLFGYPFAFIMMLVTTILAFFQSLKYDSIAVALLGLIGGFMTPFILYSGGNNFVGLFTYLGFLNCWIIALLYRKNSWKAVELISLLATYIIYFSLQGNNFYSASWIVAGSFLTLIWGLYFGLEISRVVSFSKVNIITSILNGFMFYIGIYELFRHNRPDITAIVTILVALVYLTSGILVYKKCNKQDVYLKQNVLASIILLVLATNTASTGFIKVILWSIEAFGILYVGIKFKKPYIWKSSTYLFSLAFLALLFNHQTYSYTQLDNFTPVLNLRVLAFLVLAGLSALSTIVLDKHENTGGIQSFYRYSWCTLLFILFTVEINDFMAKLAIAKPNINQVINYNRAMIQVIVWAIYSGQLVLSGLKKNIPPCIYCGFIVIFIAVIQLLITGQAFTPIDRFIPVINLRFAAFVITALILMFISKSLKNSQDKYSWSKSLHNFLSYGWCMLLFLLINFEIGSYFSKKLIYASATLSQALNYNNNMISGIGWSLYSLPLIKKGIDKKSSPLVICGGVIISLALLMGLLGGFHFEPIQSFVLLFNIRMLLFSVVIVALFIITEWLKNSSTDYPMAKVFIKVIQTLLSLFVFYILTLEAKDFFAREMYAITSQNSHFEALINMKQLTLSGIWLIYSILLMVWGILKRMKTVRYVALIILGTTIFKIFVIDLSFLSQLYRIISFIGLGVIMLASSYYYQKFSKQIHKLITEDIVERQG